MAESDRERRPAREAPRTRSQFRLFRTLTTRWADNDIYGHMNNVVHYSLFDSAVNGWLIETGLLDLQSGEEIGLVVETGCRYHGEVAFPDPVTAGIGISRLGRSSVRYEIALFGGEAQAAAAEGFFVHVNVDRATRRPVAISEARRRKFEEILL
ncbi:acyl-CoA thioesterase [Jiella endophytica]|uniref:Acyl-CoA thioesterase n=1 Tax=Jiella endophytica TaxID=2558362 RepID=A0A4Y8R7T5_9HYPH|nr:thioesterase family protein [Jiella endophytica]TFF17618.1 acyl-CoA thioesterase [Jiella endophytica]